MKTLKVYKLDGSNWVFNFWHTQINFKDMSEVRKVHRVLYHDHAAKMQFVYWQHEPVRG